MIVSTLLFVISLVILIWSADRFVEGAAATAKIYRVSPLLIGMLIVGFGTSAPEMLVSGIAAYQGSPGLALGNAFGSNIANIALILGFTALIQPIHVHSKILRKELPILLLVTIISGVQMLDGSLSKIDAIILLMIFMLLVFWSLKQAAKEKNDAYGQDIANEFCYPSLNLKKAWFWVISGLLILIASSRLLVWSAVTIASHFGVSELVIGLTVIALGTSLPELASSFCAIRKGEHDIALGNILGSNLFNTLAVIGIAGVIRPFPVETLVLQRDIPLMLILTLSLFFFGIGFMGKQCKISRLEGALLVCVYFAYMAVLLVTYLT